MIKKTLILGTLVTAAASGSVSAADLGVYGEAGTFGAGAGLALQLGDHFSARAGYSTFSYDVNDYQAEDLSLDAKAKVGAGKLLLDWYPFGGGFRLGAGAMLNHSGAKGVARPSSGGYTINGTFYPSSQIATADGQIDFDSVAPYVGFGFGRALDSTGRFNILMDVGVAFTGEPTITVNANCGTVPASVCAQIQEDVAAEQASIEEDAEALKFWPHLNVALSWRF